MMSQTTATSYADERRARGIYRTNDEAKIVESCRNCSQNFHTRVGELRDGQAQCLHCRKQEARYRPLAIAASKAMGSSEGGHAPPLPQP